jgi:hypothetical protein
MACSVAGGIGASANPVGSPPIIWTPCAAAQPVKLAISAAPYPAWICPADGWIGDVVASTARLVAASAAVWPM